MNNSINILIIENDLLILYSFENAFNDLSKSINSFDFKIEIAKSYREALKIIGKTENNNDLDLLMLNVDIPKLSSEENVVFVEDIGLNIRKTSPKTKIIMFSVYCDNYKVNNILRAFSPEGFFIKSDVNYDEFKKALCLVLSDNLYYSKTILQFVKSHFFNDLSLDKMDRQILYFLSKGIKTKDLCEYIGLSNSAIERRKRRLKQLFNTEGRNDLMLLKLAEEKGFI